MSSVWIPSVMQSCHYVTYGATAHCQGIANETTPTTLEGPLSH